MTGHCYWPLVLLLANVCQPQWTLAQTADAKGNCSPTLEYVEIGGNFVLNCGGRYEPEMNALRDKMERLRSEQHLSSTQIRAMVKASNQILGSVLAQMREMAADLQSSQDAVRNIQRILTERGLPAFSAKTPDAVITAAEDWTKRYKNSAETWSESEGGTAQDVEARKAFAQLDLDRAGQLLDQKLASEEDTDNQKSERYFQRAEAYALQFNLPSAIVFYEKAYTLDPDNPEYISSYATALMEQEQFGRAVPLLETLVTRIRPLTKDDPAYLAQLSKTLGNLAYAYRRTNRMSESETANDEALNISRGIATKSSAFQIEVDRALLNRGILYTDTKRYDLADADFKTALADFESLDENSPIESQAMYAETLKHAALLYVKTNRQSEADTSFRRSIEIQQVLMEKSQSPTIARNLAVTLALFGHYSNHPVETEKAYDASLAILRPLAKRDATAVDSLHTILMLYANFLEGMNQPQDAEKLRGEATAH
jgi:tetratricopeptide (TPR) repeat protein